MKKCMFISREFLLSTSPGGIIERAFVEELIVRHEIKPTVFCADNGAVNVPLATNSHSDVIITHEKKWLRIVFAGIRRLLPDLSWLPGYEWWSWGKECLKAASNRLRNEKYDYIHTVSFPCASHWVGLQLKKKYGIPWIAQFYDPWADNPYRPFRTKFFKKIDFTMERKVVENADIIIHDNKTIADIWRERYGKENSHKIVVLPLTVPLPQVPAIEHKERNKKLTISHIGNFMLNRTSESFICAVSRLVKQYPNFKSELQINYVGGVTEKEKELIIANQLQDIFNLVGTVPPNECDEYYQTSDIFLAIDGVNNVNLFFPSKILKYFYFQRPIIGITPQGSVLDYEMNQSKHVSLRNEDIDGIADYLYRAITDYKSLLNFNRDYWHMFSTEYVVTEYLRIVSKFMENEGFGSPKL